MEGLAQVRQRSGNDREILFAFWRTFRPDSDLSLVNVVVFPQTICFLRSNSVCLISDNNNWHFKSALRSNLRSNSVYLISNNNNWHFKSQIVTDFSTNFIHK